MSKYVYNLMIDDFVAFKDETRKSIREYVQDETQDVDERWDVFIHAGRARIISADMFIPTFKSLGNNWTDYLGPYWDRHQEYDVDYILERLMEDGERDWFIELTRGGTIDVITEFKRDAMRQFVYSFYYDW